MLSLALLWNGRQYFIQLSHAAIVTVVGRTFHGCFIVKVVLHSSICNANLIRNACFFARICRHVTLVARFLIAFKNLQRVAALQISHVIVRNGVLGYRTIFRATSYHCKLASVTPPPPDQEFQAFSSQAVQTVAALQPERSGMFLMPIQSAMVHY